jgi:hypothetical protein
MACRIVAVSDRPGLAPVVAVWLVDAFGYPGGPTTAAVKARTQRLDRRSAMARAGSPAAAARTGSAKTAKTTNSKVSAGRLTGGPRTALTWSDAAAGMGSGARRDSRECWWDYLEDGISPVLWRVRRL